MNEAENESREDKTLEEIREELRAFLGHNPSSSVEPPADHTKRYRVVKPWGDETVTIFIPDDRQPLVAALNGLTLPPRFTAMWHHESARLEVIWTAFKLSADQQELAGRSFTFDQEGLSLRCTFGDSSEQLKTIAKTCLPSKIGTPTNFRNIQSFNVYANASGKDSDVLQSLDKPRSFWIDGLPGEFDEQATIDVVRNINFFLKYYDWRSPIVVIHADENVDPIVPPVRYRNGGFPSAIAAADLDENLLSFWAAASAGNEILRYMLYWRIIEYAAFHFMAAKTKVAIKKILMSPSRGADLDAAVAKIAAAVASNDVDDVPKFNALMQTAVEPEVLWAEISANKASFSTVHVMDGGYEIAPLISASETLDNFAVGGVQKVSTALRKIRNCLSHGQDQGSKGVITPTTKNLRRLRPWVHLIARAAGEVVLYRDVS